jgi:hypothetical protein
MSASGIPLMGLVHSATLKSPGSFTSDGAGGYVQGTSAVATISCRFSKMVTKGAVGDTIRKYGYDGERAYRVMFAPRTDLQESWFLVVSSQLGVPDGTYRILNVKQQFNSVGTHHHTSIICELEDVA